MKTTTIVAVILGVLVLVSLVQAIQLNSLKTKMADSQLSVKSSSSSTPVASSGDSSKKTAALPSSVKNLPQMVGGC